MRIGLYFVPAADHPLCRAAASWLGRDAFTDASLAPPVELAEAEWRDLVAAPRRYGFHATVKAPFHLADGTSLARLNEAVEAFCREADPVMIPSLQLVLAGSFLALTAGDDPPPALLALFNRVIESFEPFRAPSTEAELAARRQRRLNPAEEARLVRWGYPYPEPRFHMTLTASVPAPAQWMLLDILQSRFAPFLGRPLAIDALALFVERSPGANFMVHSRHPFGTRS